MITQARKLEIITKHAKKFAAKYTGHYAALKGVYYAPNGSIYATNTYYALRIQNAHNFTEPVTFDAKTGERIDSPFPNVDRAFPNLFDYEAHISNVKDATDRAKFALEIAKSIKTRKYPTVQLVTRDEVTHLEIDSPFMKYQAALGKVNSGEEYKGTFNAEYIFNALAVFKDAGTKELKIGLKKGLGPILFSDEENDIDVIIMPIRPSDIS